MPISLPTRAQVAVAAPLATPLTYAVPAELAEAAAVGQRVRVPLGRRRATGYLLALEEGPVDGLRPLDALLDDAPLLDPALLHLLLWAADYYLHPPGEVIRHALPAGLAGDADRVQPQTEAVYTATPAAETTTLRGARQQELLALIRRQPGIRRSALRQEMPALDAPLKRLEVLGLVQAELCERTRDPLTDWPVQPDRAPAPTADQAIAMTALQEALTAGGFAPVLLQGVTGSGKTEVYLQLIAQVLDQGRQALVLVPEIALTPQLLGRFRSRFESRARLAVWHSGLSEGERFDTWRRIRRGEIDIVVGARSAVFVPLAQLGAIIVDEEHDGSYKQGEGFRYNGRDLALRRGQMVGCPVVLGSATPSLGSLQAARDGRYRHLQLTERATGLPLPPVELVDLRAEETLLSLPLREALAATLARGEQALLLLNRRGFSPYILCHDCGASLHCPNCDITLTFHKGAGQLRCHYCDYQLPPPEACPRCASLNLWPEGTGTERLEEELAEQLPQARIARMDRDATAAKGAHRRLVERVLAGEVDIVVGTQMIAKGHDFPRVTLVGVVQADASLNLPDFRAAERTFALLAQVAGRAGRHAEGGRVLVQTYDPEHPVLCHAAGHDVDGFCAEELALREGLSYPPFGHLANLVFAGNDGGRVEQAAQTLAAWLCAQPGPVEVLGPSPCVLVRLRGRTRWQILLKARQRPPLRRLLARLQASRPSLPAGVRLAIDVDPLDML